MAKVESGLGKGNITFTNRAHLPSFSWQFLPSQEDPEEHEVLRSPPEASEAEDAEQPPEEEEDGEAQEGADLARVPDKARAPLLVLGAHLGWLVVFVRTVGRIHLISPLFSLRSVQ